MSEKPVIEPRRKGRSGTQAMLIPSEAMVAAKLRAAPAGAVSDLGGLRRALAEEFGSDACCPVTVQRHVVAIAEKNSAPFWRMVDPDRPFARRLAGGPERIRAALAAERG
jgi:hypothetical protein